MPSVKTSAFRFFSMLRQAKSKEWVVERKDFLIDLLDKFMEKLLLPIYTHALTQDMHDLLTILSLANGIGEFCQKCYDVHIDLFESGQIGLFV